MFERTITLHFVLTILPTRFNFIDVQTEFENLYRQVRPRLQNTKRLLFKTKLINLYNKYKSTYFCNKQHGNVGISPEEMEAVADLGGGWGDASPKSATASISSGEMPTFPCCLLQK